MNGGGGGGYSYAGDDTTAAECVCMHVCVCLCVRACGNSHSFAVLFAWNEHPAGEEVGFGRMKPKKMFRTTQYAVNNNVSIY
jgi:hypothetical protein